MGISFTSGWQDSENPPHETLDYDIEELPIGAESDLTLEEKLNIIFNLSGWEKQKYLVYIDNIASCKGDRDVLNKVAKRPSFSKARNNFIYESLAGTPDRFIKGIANDHYDVLKQCEGLTYTDLIQEGWIGLLEATKRYKGNKNVKFSTYAYYWAEKYILKAIGDHIKTKQAEEQYEQQKFESSIEEKAFTIHKMEQLDSREQKILKLYAGGHTLKSIGKKFSLTKGRISQIISAISKPD